MTTLCERYRFFRAHAGGIVGEAAVCALALARAEERADALGLSAHFESCWSPWDGDCPAPAIHVDGWIEDPSGRVVASLGSIGIESWSDPYVRVAKAEMFADALAWLDHEADQRASVEASILASRATYAGAVAP